MPEYKVLIRRSVNFHKDHIKLIPITILQKHKFWIVKDGKEGILFQRNVKIC